MARSKLSRAEQKTMGFIVCLVLLGAMCKGGFSKKPSAETAYQAKPQAPETQTVEAGGERENKRKTAQGSGEGEDNEFVNADFAWLLLEGGPLEFDEDRNPPTNWELVPSSSRFQRVPVFGHSGGNQAPGEDWILVRRADAEQIESSPSDTVWLLSPFANPGNVYQTLPQRVQPRNNDNVPKTVYVHVYRRANGTLVRQHFRSPPGSRFPRHPSQRPGVGGHDQRNPNARTGGSPKPSGHGRPGGGKR